MKRFRIVFWVIAAVAAAGCADDRSIDPVLEPEMTATEQQRVHAAWRVDMIISDNPDYEMLAEYTYDAEGRLSTADMSLQYKQTEISTRYEEKFTWQEERLTRQHTNLWYKWNSYGEPQEQASETVYRYDESGNPMHDERQYEYDDEGRLIQTYCYEFEGMIYRDRLEWDERGNVVRHICEGPESNMIEEPVPGSLREWVFEYEYDNNPKPNFGLGDSFFWDGRFNPWPYAGTTEEQMARTLSRNNLTRCERSGTVYRYTYNDNGLPKTVQTIWIGVETVEPMIQTIVYKSAEN